MNKLLLTLAAAALAVGSASAQLSSIKAPVGSRRALTQTALPQIKGLLDSQAPKQTVTGSMKVNRPQLRVDDAQRSHKELSYQVNGTEAADFNLGPTGLSYSALAQNGYGIAWASLFYNDMLSRYAGNTISEISFIAWPGDYVKPYVFIFDPSTNSVVWKKDLVSVQTVNANTGQTPVNTVECDYTITGEEKLLFIGWGCTAVSASADDPYASQYGVCMPAYIDNTGNGLGAYLLATNDTGILGILGNLGTGWQDSQTGKIFAMSAHIIARTTGENGIKDNDANILSNSIVRGNTQGRGGDLTTSFVNMGLDPITSFDYTIECDGVSKSGTYTLNQPLTFYSAGVASFNAVLGKEAGVSEGSFTIDKVNTVADEYTDNNDNTMAYTVITMEKGYNRTPVIEEFTSTGCGYCPYGIAAMDNFEKAYGKEAVLIAVHTDFNGVSDEMKDDTYAETMEAYNINSYPSALINRQYSGHPYTEAPEIVSAITNGVCEASMTVKASKQRSMRGTTVSATTNVTFAIDVLNGEYGLIYVLTEDGITGVDQLNYLAAQYNQYKAQGYSDDVIFNAMGWDAACAEIAKAGKADAQGNYWYQPTFNSVSRGTTAFDGSADLVPATAANTNISFELSGMAVPENVKNVDNLKLAVLLLDKKTGNVVTGRQVALDNTESNASGIDEATADDARIEVAAGAFNIKAGNAKAMVYDLSGKLVSSCTVNGEASLPTFGKGVFIIRVETEGKVKSMKAVF